MTSTIFTDFEHIEAAAKKTMRGPDYEQIIRILAYKYDVPQDEVRKIITENTIQGPC